MKKLVAIIALACLGNSIPLEVQAPFFVATPATGSIVSGGSPLITTGLQLYWKYDDNSGTIATDVSGNSFNGTLTGATWSSPYIGTASLLFNGTSDKVTGPTSTSLEPGTGDMTYSAWIKCNTKPGTMVICGKLGGNGTYMQLAITGNGFAAVSCQGEHAANTSIQNGVDLSDNAWHFISGNVVTTGGVIVQASLYVDGVFVGTDTGNTVGPVDPGTAFVSGSTGSGSYFVGTIDEVSVYNRALTDVEETTLFNQTHP